MYFKPQQLPIAATIPSSKWDYYALGFTTIVIANRIIERGVT